MSFLIFFLMVGLALAVGVLVGRALQHRRVIELERNMASFETEKRFTQERQTQMLEQFENLGHKIFEKHTATFKTDSKENLDNLLSPFKERMKEFQEKVERLYGEEAQQRASLKGEIARIVSVNEQMSQDARNLTLALKGDVKTQGGWGEVMLERILEASGLREGEEYTIQGRDMRLASEDGRRLKPDVIVHLPDNRQIIIDSKVSLTNYEAHMNAEDKEEAEGELKRFLNSVYAHVDGLASKQYHYLEQLVTPEIVLMFMPLEGAFMVAMKEEIALQKYAWDKCVAIVSPTTLFATLKTIESVWKLERQNKNALEIARRAGLLYDKFAGFVGDLEGLGVSLKKTEEAYQNALGKLSQGRGNLMVSAENLKKLGAKASKALPEKFLSEEEPEELNTPREEERPA